MTPEEQRLEESHQRTKHWKRWGPYLSERQWGTVREDYSPNGTAWEYFPHEHARSRAYRWGEDGIGGISDRHQRICFALALWNGRDPILKERLFGLTGNQGNHGEDVKEYYFYLDSTPTHSYMKYLYKYPQAAFPYEQLVEENGKRSKRDPEFELIDTGVFNESRYFDVFIEYAKASPEDILIKITAWNRGPEEAQLDLLPTLWFRNIWSFGEKHGHPRALARSRTLWARRWLRRRKAATASGGCWPKAAPEMLFTENETNFQRVFGFQNATPYVKDSFHDYLLHGAKEAVNPAQAGTKCAAHHRAKIAPGLPTTIRLRLTNVEPKPGAANPFDGEFEKMFDLRRGEADQFYAQRFPQERSDDAHMVMRQALAGMLWSKQCYHYDVRTWLNGDPGQPPPPARTQDRAATTIGRTSTTPTFFRCRINGSIRGMPRGIWHFIPLRCRWSIPILRKSNSSCCSANGTCIRVGNCRRTSGPSAT